MPFIELYNIFDSIIKSYPSNDENLTDNIIIMFINSEDLRFQSIGDCIKIVEDLNKKNTSVFLLSYDDKIETEKINNINSFLNGFFEGYFFQIKNYQQLKQIFINISNMKCQSNFFGYDFNIFDQIKGVEVHYIKDPMEIDDMDVIILPGTKNVIDDMRFLEKSGLSDKIKEYEKNGNIIFGICGGYQLLGKKIKDPYNVEAGGEIDAIGLLDVETVLSKEKIRRRVKGKIAEISGELDILSNLDISGYEIHMGITKGNVSFLDKISEIESSDSKDHKETFLDGSYSKNIYGSYIHGIFDEKNMALGFIKALAANKNKCGRLKDTEYKDFINNLNVIDDKAFKEEQYDALADTLRESLDMKKIYGILKDSVI